MNELVLLLADNADHVIRFSIMKAGFNNAFALSRIIIKTMSDIKTQTSVEKDLESNH